LKADTPIAAQRQGGAEVLDECGNKVGIVTKWLVHRVLPTTDPRTMPCLLQGPETVFREAGRVVNDVIMTLSRLGLSPGSTDAQMLY
jgi:hypothetical protein